MTKLNNQEWKAEQVKDVPNEPGIYLIRCKQNGRFYIGATVNLKRRLHDHLSLMAISPNHSPMGSDYQKFGRDAFEVEVLEIAGSRGDLFELEYQWSEALNTSPDMSYNTEPAKHNRFWIE